MAEGWGNHLKSGQYGFYSAGTVKQTLNPYALRVMNEVGVSMAGQYSKTTQELPQIDFSVVITVCKNAHEQCPIYKGSKLIHFGFDDPPYLTKDLTNDEAILKVYRKVRDEIKDFVLNLESHILDK